MKLELYIKEKNIPAELINCNGEVRTVEQAARILGVDEQSIIKSMILATNNRSLILVISPGKKRIDIMKLASILNLKEIALASPKVVEDVTDYSVCAVPPFGHRTPLRTVIDAEVLKREVVYAGGGANKTMIKIRSRDLVEATKAEVVKLDD